MSLELETIQYLANLSRLNIEDDQAKEYVTQLDSILGYMKELDDVDVSSVEGGVYVGEAQNVTRKDEVIATQEDIHNNLLTATDSVEDNLFKVNKVL